MSRSLVVLGSTGSIGTQCLDIVRANLEEFRVVALAGGFNVELLAEQALEFLPPAVSLADDSLVEQFTALIAQNPEYVPEVIAGPDAATQLAALKCDVVVHGITGAIGLGPTIAALQAGNTIALANKESLVVGGKLVTKLAKPGQLVPVDSEHSALAQCLRGGRADEVRKLILTASGGPFLGKTQADLKTVTREQALAHPNWSMGPVVTINSASMMNKGLEVIEAHLLFDIPMENIDVVVHPQSVVHSMVEFIDGSTLAQASPPDMHLPIALGMSWPDRLEGASTPCDWTTAATWTFLPVDHETFPALNLAKRAGQNDGPASAVMNAANEVAVADFLADKLSFLDITRTVAHVLDLYFVSPEWNTPVTEITHVYAAIEWAEARARDFINELS